jgi:putative addiction module killer protein
MSAAVIFRETSEFADWFEKLRNQNAKAGMAARIDPAGDGNFGGRETLDGGVCETRTGFGPGYRVYHAQEGLRVYLLVIGGDTSFSENGRN